MMCDCLRLCLEKAKADRFFTIAFPTLGCGHLKYSSEIVAKCFNKVAQSVDGLQVS